MYLLCGLGNKGAQYAFTRHNIGYLVVDRFSARYSIPVTKKKSGMIVGRSPGIILAKPNTYMNLSGDPVQAFMTKERIKPEQLIVAHDDLDMDFGRLRIRSGGGDGGHKGVRSIIETLGTRDFYRLKIGIGRDPLLEPEDFVLTPFTREEAELLYEILDRAVEAIHTFTEDGKEKAMSMYNRK